MNPYLTQALDALRIDSLLDCISLLREYAYSRRLSPMLDAVERISRNYAYMLDYLAAGSADPGREAMYCDLRGELQAIIGNAMTDEEAADSPRLYCATLRTVRFRCLTFADALGRFISAETSLQLSGQEDGGGSPSADEIRLLNEKDRALTDIFSVIWTLPLGSGQQLEQIKSVGADPDIAFSLRCVIVGALSMALLERYDPAEFSALLDIEGRTPDARIRARALTGIVLALARNAPEIRTDPRLDARFETWCDDITNYTRLREVVYALVRTRGSERLARKIQADIMPGISQIGTDFLKSIRESDHPVSLEDIQENPEWERLMRETGLDKKMRRIHRMHEKGADMMLPMFSQLSGHFFFRNADVWFRPFERWETLRAGLDSEMADMLDALPANNTMCDTDKYAVMLNLTRVPAATREMMKQAFSAGKEQLGEELKDLSLQSSHPDFDLEALSYARMLYRFFNYFRLHGEFFNPFATPIDFPALPYIGRMLCEDEILHNIGETYFHQGFYGDAVEIYLDLIRKQPAEEALLCQKAGYCYERDSNPAKALEYYQLARRSGESEEDLWLFRHMYEAAKAAGNTKAMSAALHKLVELDKENLLYLRSWLSLTLDEGIYTRSEEKIAQFEKRLAKYLYFAGEDDAEAMKLSAEVSWRKGEYMDVILMLAPRMAEIGQYLRTASDASADSDAKKGTSAASESEESMAADKLLSACAQAALGNNKEAVKDLRDMLKLSGGTSTAKQAELIAKRASQSPSLTERALIMPMLLEAARR